MGLLFALSLPTLLPGTSAVAGGIGAPAALKAAAGPSRLITVTGTTVAATQGTSFSGTVATFSLPDTSATATQFAASVAWGDGSPSSTGTVTGPTGGSFVVTGSHTFAASGSYAVTTTVVDLTNPAPTGTYQVVATTVAGPNQSGTGSNPAGFATATASCPAGTVLVSGGGLVQPSSVDVSVHLIGTFPSDASAHPVASSGTPASSWTAIAESGLGSGPNATTAWAVCATGGPVGSVVALNTVAGPSGASGFATTTVSCPTGTTLTGGGAETIPGNLGNPSGQPSPLHLNGSYPSDASGNQLASGSSTSSWTATAEEGADVGPGTTTSVFAVCSSTSMSSQVAATTVAGPFGPGGSVTTTASCPSGTLEFGGGGFTLPPSNSGQPSPLHFNGAFPSDAAGNPLAGGVANPSAWSASAREGNDVGNPPGTGTTTSAQTLCSNAANTASGTGTATVSPASGGGPVSVQVSAVTGSVASVAGSATPVTANCAPGKVLISGGIRAFFATGDSVVVGSVYEPINGLVMRGTYPSDASGATTTASNPAFWTALGGFAGQNENGDDVTSFAMCATGVPANISVASSTINAPTAASTTAATTATCPAGTTLLGGGALMGPNGTAQSAPSQKPIGSYPSDPTGSTSTVTDPNSWTAVGNSGGQADAFNFTTAFALCAAGASLHTQVVRTDNIGHPAGQGNSNPGQDPVATATATCPVGTTLLSGGELADSSQPTGLQQGVHVRGSYPSDASANPVADGSPSPSSWSAIEQSGGQATPGTNTHAFALCTQAAAAPSADLALTKSANPTTVTQGGRVTYTLVATNNGPSPATNVAVSDALPASESLISASSTQGTCGGTTTVTCGIGGLANAASATVTVVATVTGTGSIANTATVNATEADPNSANNSATATVITAASADLSITKAANPTTVTQGGRVTYTVVATNNGPSAATGVSVTDALPAGETFVSASSTQGTCGGMTTVTCTIGGLASGASATVTIVATVTGSGSIANTATVAGNESDPNAANNSATATIAANPGADMAITKTGPATATVGTPFTYAIVVTNNGPSSASNLVVTDVLPAGLTYASSTKDHGPGCVNSSNTVTCGLGALSAGLTANFTITVTPTVAGPVTNTASISATESDPNPANNSASATTAIASPASADLAITKTANPTTLTQGGRVTYTLTATNNGPSPATGVSVNDTLPASETLVSASAQGTCGGTTTVTCSIGNLASGASATVTIVATVNGTGPVANTATVSANESDPNTTNNTATATVTAAAAADLSITKAANPTTVTQGGRVTYTLTATNNGPSPATGVSVTDALPAGETLVSSSATPGTCSGTTTVTCSIGNLAVGASATATIVATVNGTGSIANTATVSANESDPNPANNSSTATISTAASADLSITKAANPTTVTQGGRVTYTVVATNNGPSAATGVSVTDALPAGETFVSASTTQGACGGTTTIVCSFGTLASGASATATIVATVTTTGTIANSATVSANESDPNAANNSATATITATASADLSLTKGANPTTVTQGGRVTYTVVATNNGPSTATGVSVTDNLPAGETLVSASSTQGTCSGACSIGTLPSGASATVTIVAQVNTTGTIANTATVSANESDPNPANNTASATITVAAATTADLSITKTANPTTVTPGGLVTYTVVATNNGPAAAATVTVSDTLPSGEGFVSASTTQGSCTTSTCTLGTLASGASATVTIVATVGGTGTFTNTATVSSPTADPNLANNSASATVSTAGSADIAVTKTASPTTLTQGGQVTYTVVATNNGPDAATGVTVTDTLPAGETFVSSSTTQGSCTTAAGVSCPIGTLASGASATVTIVATATGTGSIANTASASANQADPNNANNSSSATITVTAPTADLAVTKTGPANAFVAIPVTYTLVATNNGPNTATGATVTDTLPAGMTFSSASSSQGSCVNGALVTCSLGTLAPGASATILVVVTPNQTGTAINNAMVAGHESDPNGANNAASVTTAVFPTPTGLLRVTTSPAVPTRISVTPSNATTPVPMDQWGLNWVKLAQGTYTLSFSDVPGFETPAPQQVTITGGSTTVVNGAFTADGFLRVQLSPAGIDGTISVDGTPRDDYGYWSYVTPGSHQVCYGTVRDFAAPACQTVTVTAGSETDVTGTYTSSPGAPFPTNIGLLRVTTGPAVPTRLSLTPSNSTTPIPMDQWGLNWVKLTPGSYTLRFSDVPGLETPAPQQVTIVAGGTTVINGTFSSDGFLRVQLSPAGADGTISVNGLPRDDFGMWSFLPPATYQVCFGAAPGYTNTPPCQNATVSGGGAETDVTGTYSGASSG